MTDHGAPLHGAHADGPPIADAATSIAAFVGTAPAGPTNEPVLLHGYGDVETALGGLHRESTMSYALRDFFANGGARAIALRIDAGAAGAPAADDDYLGSPAEHTGLFALDKVDLFNVLCVPPPARAGATSGRVWRAALAYCARRRAMLLVDPAADWTAANAGARLDALGLSGPEARDAAVYFPRVRAADPLLGGRIDGFVPSGAVAGVIARVDAGRGVWTAPAGGDAVLDGVAGLACDPTDAEMDALARLGVNCLRPVPGIGQVIWGARTLAGAGPAGDGYGYVPVRRLALFIEESLDRGTRWAVFEPNDEPLWARLRRAVESFMHGLYARGAFAGTTPQRAYFVRCDRTTMTQDDIDRGVVVIVVGFAPLEPAEFVTLTIRQTPPGSDP